MRSNPDNWRAFLQQASLGLRLTVKHRDSQRTYTSEIAFQFAQLPFVEIPTSLDEKISAGALAGIVIGCLLAILTVVVFIYIMIKIEEAQKGIGYTLHRYRLGQNNATGVV